MLNLFKKTKVKQGKQTQPDNQAAAQKKKESPMVALRGVWKKLNSMDRKQAYTWGAVGLVAVIGLLILLSAASGNQDDFSDFETRGYDLANMPFSSDEAEQYLLASKYPDMKEGNQGMGLYSEEEKEARQEEDAENAELEAVESSDSGYREGRYYGGAGGRVGSGTRTKVGSLNSASLKGASGSGMSGRFGPSGDFSNFRNQNKGYDRAPGKGPGTGNARTALRQTAMASRAAAGLKNDKLLNAKKALMGGAVDGSGAFMDDSGAVNLGEAKGLDLDTNAPVSSADLSGLDQGLSDARDDAQKDAQNEDEEDFWKTMAQEFLKKVVDIGINLAENAMNTAIADARMAQAENMQLNEQSANAFYDQQKAAAEAQAKSLARTNAEAKAKATGQEFDENAFNQNWSYSDADFQRSLGSSWNGKTTKQSYWKQNDPTYKTTKRNNWNTAYHNAQSNRQGPNNTWTIGGNNNSGTVQINGNSYHGYACGNNWCNNGKVIANGNGNGSYSLVN